MPGALKKIFAASVCLLLCSCSAIWTQLAQYDGTRSLLARGDVSAAKTQIESQAWRYAQKDRVLYLLDLGMLQHFSGDYEASNRSLDEAALLIEDAVTKSISRGTASLLLNDNVLVYAGEDYESVYLHLFKALNFLALENFDGAFVEIRQIDEKLKTLEDRHWKIAEQYNRANEMGESFAPGSSRFQNSALARWISLLIYRAEGRPDEAAIDLQKIGLARATQPDLYPFSSPSLSEVLTPPASGTVRVPLLAFTGLAPEKRADSFWIHTQKDRIFISAVENRAQRFVGPSVIPWEGVEPGYTFHFQIPRIEKSGSNVRNIRVLVDGKPVARMEAMEYLENAAEAAFEIQKPIIYLKSVLRTVTKGLAAKEAENAAEETWGERRGRLTGLLAGFGLGLTESADLRISRFFPARAYINELELAPGPHRIAFEYLGYGDILLFRDERTVQVRTGDVNLIESFYLN